MSWILIFCTHHSGRVTEAEGCSSIIISVQIMARGGVSGELQCPVPVHHQGLHGGPYETLVRVKA